MRDGTVCKCGPLTSGRGRTSEVNARADAMTAFQLAGLAEWEAPLMFDFGVGKATIPSNAPRTSKAVQIPQAGRVHFNKHSSIVIG